MTSCFVYKVMGLTFHNMINIQLIYRFEVAQVVARRIIKPQRNFLGSKLTGCSLLFIFLNHYLRGWGGLILLLFSSCLNFFLFIYLFFFLFFTPLTCIWHIYKTSVTTQTTVNSEIYAKL